MVADVAQRLGGQADVHVVWMPVISGDRAERAAEATEDHVAPPARSWWLPDQRLGRAWAPRMGLLGTLAWDVVLVFGPEARWESAPPAPRAWWHQLSGEPLERRMGPDLAQKLLSAAQAARPR